MSMKPIVLYSLVVFFGIAVFFLVDAYAAALIFALSGAASSWFASRTGDKFLLAFGFFFSLLSLHIFADSVYYFYSATIFLNLYFAGSVFLVLSALFSAHRITCFGEEYAGSQMHNLAAGFLFIVAAFLWYSCGAREIVTQIILPDRMTGLLLFTSGSSIFFGILEEKLEWRPLGWSFYLQLPAMLLLLVLAALWNWPQNHLLFGWSVAFFVQYRILWVFERRNSKGPLLSFHLGTLFLLCYVSATLFPPTLLVPLAWGFLVLGLRAGSLWPVKTYPTTYIWCTALAAICYFGAHLFNVTFV